MFFTGIYRYSQIVPRKGNRYGGRLPFFIYNFIFIFIIIIIIIIIIFIIIIYRLCQGRATGYGGMTSDFHQAA